jgi:ABC-type Fe3+-hydroxamate transport system substrate-binding protein
MQKTFTDQMHRNVSIPFPPKRIVSLVPSQTELLYDLGLDAEIVGQTLFCIHPADKHALKPRIGGTKKLSFEKIAALQPDLIIGNKEENQQEQIEWLMKDYTVWMSDIHNLDQALEMIEQIGELVDRAAKAKDISTTIRKGFENLNTGTQPLRTTYLIWRDPWMGAGHDTFISDLLQRCGLINVLESLESRYPSLNDTQLKTLNPELILLSSEPFPFKEKHMAELQNICPDAAIQLVDGEMFSWYGSRLLKSVEYLKNFEF